MPKSVIVRCPNCGKEIRGFGEYSDFNSMEALKADTLREHKCGSSSVQK